MRVPIIAASLALTALVGCGGADRTGSDAATGATVHVVAGFYPLAEAAREAGGDAVRVTNLTPAGAEAHDIELSSDQLDAVLDADLVLLLGGGFQPALEAAVAQREGPTLDLLEHRAEEQPDGGEGQAEEDGHGHAEDDGHGHSEEGGTDPHVWLDPREFAEIAEEVSQALIPMHPDDEELQRRTELYVARLRALDVEFEKGLDRCQRRDIVTTHAAFGHLAEAYRLEQKPISGLSPEAEPDPARLAELSDHVSRTGATTIFVEPLAPSEAAETLARETGTKTAQLNPLEGLTPSQLEADETYETVMRTNLEALREGLDCQ